MDVAREAESLNLDRPIESHLLTFWPAPPAPDRVVRTTSRTAAYWQEAWWENGSRRQGQDCS
jgi:hypothetical protein